MGQMRTTASRRRRSRVKMKPPWPPMVCQQEARRARTSTSCFPIKKPSLSLLLSLLLVIISFTSCDRPRTRGSSSSMLAAATAAAGAPTLIDDDHHQRLRSAAAAASEPGQPADVSSEAAITAAATPHFAPNEPKDLIVIASSWQSEVYLPCKIINLDEDQTVSCCCCCCCAPS